MNPLQLTSSGELLCVEHDYEGLAQPTPVNDNSNWQLRMPYFKFDSINGVHRFFWIMYPSVSRFCTIIIPDHICNPQQPTKCIVSRVYMHYAPFWIQFCRVSASHHTQFAGYLLLTIHFCSCHWALWIQSKPTFGCSATKRSPDASLRSSLREPQQTGCPTEWQLPWCHSIPLEFRNCSNSTCWSL